MLASSFPPAIRNNWYDEKVDIAGEVPDSFHLTDIVPPPGSDAPAAGVVNSTSARASEASVPNSERSCSLMMMIAAVCGVWAARKASRVRLKRLYEFCEFVVRCCRWSMEFVDVWVWSLTPKAKYAGLSNAKAR